MTTTAPFAAKSISCRLYPHNDLDAPSIVREVCAQGKLALDGGFDGVMTSEQSIASPRSALHHACSESTAPRVIDGAPARIEAPLAGAATPRAPAINR